MKRFKKCYIKSEGKTEKPIKDESHITVANYSDMAFFETATS